jgi:hypothetical protein
MLLISITFSQILNPVGKNGMKIKIKVERTIANIYSFFSLILTVVVCWLANETHNVMVGGSEKFCRFYLHTFVSVNKISC